MSPDELVFQANLKAAVQALTEEVRNHPSDARRRTFLFELLCFSGELERAEKHLQLLEAGGKEAELGALLYRSALAAERKRQAFFESRQYEQTGAQETSARRGTLNGRPFEKIEDLDPRIGPRLELFVAGEYVWLPFEHLGSLRMESPRFLRDTLWRVVSIQTGPKLRGQNFGEALAPALSPFTWKHPSDEVRLGRATDWKTEGGEQIPYGQKLFVFDDEHVVPMMEVRELVFLENETQELSQQQTLSSST